MDGVTSLTGDLRRSWIQDKLPRMLSPDPGKWHGSNELLCTLVPSVRTIRAVSLLSV